MISVIVPTHNRSDALAQTLAALSAQKFNGDWETIIVNNNCTDETDAIVRQAAQSFPVPLHLAYEKMPGAAAARNAGARLATGEFLVFIDNDILTEPDFLQRHSDALRQNPNSWIVGQVVNLPAQENSVFGKYRKTLFPIISTDEPVRESDGITGQNFSLPRRDFEKVNGFDENLVFCGEDQDLAMRAREQLGIKTLLVPGILVVHNDWAGWTFEDFCRRQQIYANTEFFIWKKYGNEHPRLRIVLEGFPIDWRKDSFSLKMRKLRKQFLGNDISQKLLLQITNLLEKLPRSRPLLWQFYKLRLAGAINRGIQEGRNNYLSKK